MNGTNRIEGDCDGTPPRVSYTITTRFSTHAPDRENEFKRYLQSFYECCR